MPLADTALAFDVSGSDPDGLRRTVRFIIHQPVVGPGRDEYTCLYDVGELGVSGSAVGTNPLLAIRYALMKIRTQILHRCEGWKFYYLTGEEMSFQFDEAL